MSKSLGTGIDPLHLIEGGDRPRVFTGGGEFPAYGADAVRFGLLAMSSTQDVRFSEEKVGQGQALANKLFNATRFVLLNVGDDVAPAADPQTVEDRWILSRLEAAKAEFSARIDAFDFSKASLGLYDFIYGELCDWYLELIKGRDMDARLGGHLLHVLRETLILAHPVIPFVTEELWSHMPGAEGLLAAHRRTNGDPALRDPAAEADIARVIATIQAVRSWRDASGIKPGEFLEARFAGLNGLTPLVARLARLTPVEDDREPVATIPVGGGQVDLLTGVDPAEAAAKVEAQRAYLRKEIAIAEKKLSNEGFVAKAPPEVVAAQREKLERYRAELEALEG
jgi:valyl-tRNA synthetase